MIYERHIGGPPPGEDVRIELPRFEALPGGGHGPGDTFIFISTEMSFGNKIVKNAPYSAQATNETVQVLGDGNRIVRKNTATVYRDSEGRTRHDQTLSSIGPWATGDPQQTSFINDPVAGAHYVLEPRTRIARKLPLPPAPPPPPARISGEGRNDMKVRVIAPPPPGAPGEDNVQVIVGGEGARVMRDKRPDNNLRRESLGKQNIEGVEAEGTRETFTIPAGEIGNEQPIQIVSERWFAPALQTVVLSKHSDPRFGETTFRLTGITRSEPARTLFEVPSDYTIKEGPPPPRTFRKRIGDEK
jgi:hypothetical protein